MNEQQHTELELVGAYALDALPEEEARAFEVHLRGCPTCRSEVEELREVTELLPLAVEPAEPPLGLRSRILAEAQDGPPRPALTVIAGDARTPRSIGSRLRQPTGWIAAVAAALIIGLGAWNIALQRQVHNQPEPSAVASLLAHGARSWPVAGTALDPGATGSLIQPKHGGNAILVLDGVPPTPSSKVYQVWFMRGTTPTSAGTFSVTTAGTQVFHLIRAATGFQIAAMTVEPGPHGSSGPTTKALISGTLGA